MGESSVVAQDDAPALSGHFAKDIPEVTDDDGTHVRVVVGDFWGKKGPVEGVAAEPRYLDVWVPPGKKKSLKVERGAHAFAYVFEGDGKFRDASAPRAIETEQVGTLVTPGEAKRADEDFAQDRNLVLFGSGDEITVQAGEHGIRFLLVSGKPIEEPVAWYGPIVMNTEQELRKALSDLRDGTFIEAP